MTPFESIPYSDLLVIWFACCRSTRQAIIQYQKCQDENHLRSARAAILALNQLKLDIAPLIVEQAERRELEWAYLTVLHLYVVLEPLKLANQRQAPGPDQFETVLDIVKGNEVGRLISKYRLS